MFYDENTGYDVITIDDSQNGDREVFSMSLMSETFDSICETGLPLCSTQDWPCAMLSFAMHVLMACIVVFCVPAISAHRGTVPQNEIIMVSMDNLPPAALPGQAGEAGAKAAQESSAPPKPVPEKTENSKPFKPASIHIKPKPPVSMHIKPKTPISVSKAKSEKNVEKPPEPAPISENMHHAEAAKESPPAEMAPSPSENGSSSQSGNTVSGSGASGKGNAPGGSGGNGHGPGAGNGTGTGLAAGSDSGTGTVEGRFGTASGPSFIRRVKPNFPRRALVLGKEGTVVLRLTVDRTGNLSHVEVVTDAGFGFDEEAVRAVRKSTFSPAVRNGQPVACVAELSVSFKLESNE